MKSLVISLYVLVFVAVFGCGARNSSPSGVVSTPDTVSEEASINAKLGNITLKDVDGRSISLSEITSGKIAIISFFATFCEPCKQKTMDHQLLYDEYKAQGLVVVGISVDEPETAGDVRPFVKSRNISFPVLLDTDFEAVSQLNPRRTLPYSLIVDSTGKTIWTHEGYVPGDDKLTEEQVVKALEKN